MDSASVSTGAASASRRNFEELSTPMADFTASAPSAHSAAVYRYAVELVEDTRRANETRMADARDLAAVVRIADEPAADRILGAAEEACARDLHIAEQQAEEVVRHARSGIMAAVQRYAQALIEDARNAGQSRLDKATELAELVRLADASSADRLLQAIHTVNEAALRTAERQANGVLEAAQSRLTISSRVSEPTPSPYSTQNGPPLASAAPAATAAPAAAAAAPAAPAEETVMVGEPGPTQPQPAPPVPSYYSSPSNGTPTEPRREEVDDDRYRPEGS
jgi:hypothetical protein